MRQTNYATGNSESMAPIHSVLTQIPSRDAIPETIPCPFALSLQQGMVLERLPKTGCVSPETHTETLILRGLENALRGNYEVAIADYGEAIELEQNPDAFWGRGMLQALWGETSEALADLRQAATLYQQQGNLTRYYLTVEQIQELWTSDL